MVFMMLPSLCYAGDWSTKDTALEIVSEGLTLVDWRQTADIINHNGMVELNPILGKQPSEAAINAYFIAWLLLHPVISFNIPENHRTIWQSIYIGVELATVGSNFRGGLKMAF